MIYTATTAKELASKSDFFVNGQKVTHYVANGLPIPSEYGVRFFGLVEVAKND